MQATRFSPFPFYPTPTQGLEPPSSRKRPDRNELHNIVIRSEGGTKRWRTHEPERIFVYEPPALKQGTKRERSVE